MKKSILFTTVFLFIITTIFAQKRREIPSFDSFHKNITVELLGSHIFLGANFDMRLKRGQMDGIGFKAGIGGLYVNIEEGVSSGGIGMVSFPIEFNHVIGKKRHGFITGVGVLPVYETRRGTTPFFGSVKENSFEVVRGFATLGYRYSPLEKGITFQLTYNPMVLKEEGYRS